MPEPAISVLMPVHNGAATIGAALRDLIAGLGPSDEIVVVDDGSDDNTLHIVHDLAFAESRVRLVRGARQGLVGALNRGLTEVAHRWVARADADDRYPADRLRRQRRACRDGVVLISGDYVVEGSHGSLGLIPTALGSSFVLTSLLHPQRVPHPGVVFDREAVLSVGGYKSEDFPAEDLALWMRLAGTGNFVGIPAITVHWRIHAGSVTQRQQAIQRVVTRQLLTSSFPVSTLHHIDADQVTREIESYRDTPAAVERALLLARDLRTLASRGVGKHAYRESLRALGKHPVKSLTSASALTAQALRRRRLRRSMSHG